MRTVLVVLLAIGLFAVAMPATVSASVSAGATYCYVDDVVCMVKCETKSAIGSVTGREHECYIWG